MRGDVIGTIIDTVKPIARDRVAEYQADFSTMLSVVRNVLSNYPGEYSKTHVYQSFAERLYHVIHRFKEEALQAHVDALFQYFAMLGLNKDALMQVAKGMGVEVSDPYIHLQRFGLVDVQHTRHEITIPAYEPIGTSYSVDVEPETAGNYIIMLWAWYQTVSGVSVKLVLYKREGEVVELPATDLTGEWLELNKYGLLTKASIVFTVSDVLTEDSTVYCEVKAIEISW